MDLAKAFAEQQQRRKDDLWARELGIVARFAMQPWDLGNVTISIEDDQRTVRTIWIEFENLRDLPFRFKFDEWMVLKAFDPQAYLVDSMRQPLFEHIRYRPSLPVEDHIVLGED